VPAPAVADDPARHSHERGRSLVEPIEHPELQGREAEREDQVDRQDGGDHLRGEVGEEARQAEEEDGAIDARAKPKDSSALE
jgi:hypothetical protein